jgi:hypothetical protein
MNVTGVNRTTDSRDAGVRWTVQRACEGSVVFRQHFGEAGVTGCAAGDTGAAVVLRVED